MAAGDQHPRARLIGFVYLLFFLTGIPAGSLFEPFWIRHDATATANAVLSREVWYRAAIALDILSNAFYLAFVAVLYDLLKQVGRRLALIFAFLGAVAIGIQIAGILFHSAPLLLLKDSHAAATLSPVTIREAVLISFKFYSQTYSITLVLWGLFDAAVGWLILRSGFLPWVIGAFWICAGAAWLTHLWPPLATQLFGYVLAFNTLSEGSLLLWLLFMGVNVPRWREGRGQP